MTWLLEPGSTAPAQARWHVAEILDGDVAVRADAELIASELVTNAWKHGTGLIELTVDEAEDGWRICVCSESDSDPVVGTPTDSGGRGLLMIKELTSAWGFTREGARVCVWATLRVR